jgi:hypothetical protein
LGVKKSGEGIQNLFFPLERPLQGGVALELLDAGQQNTPQTADARQGKGHFHKGEPPTFGRTWS